jgi:hypothetical protein
METIEGFPLLRGLDQADLDVLRRVLSPGRDTYVVCGPTDLVYRLGSSEDLEKSPYGEAEIVWELLARGVLVRDEAGIAILNCEDVRLFGNSLTVPVRFRDQLITLFTTRG